MQANVRQISKGHGLSRGVGFSGGARLRIRSGQNSFDRGSRGAEIVGRLEELRDGLRVENGVDFSVGRKNFAKMAALGLRTVAGLFHELVSGGAIQLLAESERDGFGVDEAAREFEIGAHSIRVYREARKQRGEVV